MLHLIKNPIADKSLEGMDSSKGFLNVVNTQDMTYAPDAILNLSVAKSSNILATKSSRDYWRHPLW